MTTQQTGSTQTAGTAGGGYAEVEERGITGIQQREGAAEVAQRARRRLEETSPQQLAEMLGWFSVGLGLAQVLIPRTLCRLIGVRDHPLLMRLLGARELASGATILWGGAPGTGVWTRVAGDAMDLALLGAAFQSPYSGRAQLAVTTAAVAGVTAVDAYCAAQMSPDAAPVGEPAQRWARRRGVHVQRAVTINRPVAEVFSFWRDLTNLPRFMEDLESVEVIGEGRTRWVVSGPRGMRVAWEAETTELRENELIAWRSTGGDIDTEGTVRFRPGTGGRGTVVDVEMRYTPPAGVAGDLAARVMGASPQQRIAADLRRLKQIMETGEIATSEGAPRGRCMA